MNKTICLIALALILCSSTSCSSKKVEPEKPAEDNEPAVSGEVAGREGPIFTYDDGKIRGAAAPEIYLTSAGEPVQVPPLGFAKFKGAITGERPAALLEISGKGAVVRLGEKLGEYTVDEIRAEYLRLRIGKR